MTTSFRLKHRAAGKNQQAPARFSEQAAILRLSKVEQNNLSDGFRLAMRELVGGVCVITTGQGDDRAGLTATAVSSLSMTPPSLLVSIQCASRTLQTLLTFGAFGVNLLTEQQRDIADLFSGRAGLQGAMRFDGYDWKTGSCGVPVLWSALAAVECTIERAVEWRTHCIVVGKVSSVLVKGEGEALVYWRGRYGVPVDSQPPQ